MGDPLTYEQLVAQNAALRREVAFWQDQQHLAANVAAGIADLDEVAPVLRQMLRTERARRHQVENDLDRARYELLLKTDAAAIQDRDRLELIVGDKEGNE